jgi:hypothetical protein
MAKKDELPQDLTDRIAKEENAQDRNMIVEPVKKAYNAIKNSTVVDELSRGVKRIGQDLGITKDENQYEDKARMDSIRKAVRNEQAIEGGRQALRAKDKKDSTDFKKGGKVKSASARADGCAIRGKTRA